jgi:hypothetical protein
MWKSRAEESLYTRLYNKYLTLAFSGQFIPERCGQSHRLFQYIGEHCPIGLPVPIDQVKHPIFVRNLTPTKNQPSE